MENIIKARTNPGIHRDFSIHRFEKDEQDILKKLSGEWYLTNSGKEIRLAGSSYNFFLMKPTQIYKEMFNIEREILCVFSRYERFEPRTLDAFDAAQNTLSDYRLEPICKVLISKDDSTEIRIDSILKADPEQPIVIPFTYQELISPYDSYFIRNRFRKHLYTRDLFSFLSPLKKDLYFFGRSELVQNIVNRHKSGEHTGLFGLRKCGKTSIIYAVERLISSISGCYVSIDCEMPSVHQLRWYELLHKIATLYHEARKSKIQVPKISDYTSKTAADAFQRDILEIYKSKKHTSTLIIFDEIERIAPTTASSEHWRKDDDFVYFWQTMRAVYQRYPEIFTYLLVGTNPNCVEMPIIGGIENPLFASIPSQYVPAFTVSQVREMVRKLGRYMGLKFDEVIYAKLTEDFGGHPFLIRQLCSQINNICKGERPIRVDKGIYERVKEEFSINSAEYLYMIIEVLKEWYPDEYDMLTFLAQDDYHVFSNLAQENPEYVKHLLGYGLIQKGVDRYFFSIESVKDYLRNKQKYERINLTDEEKWQELSERRNKLEKNLRELIKRVLIIGYGRDKAREKVLSALTSKRREKLIDRSLEELLSKEKSPLYFNELKSLIDKYWGNFEHVFEIDKSRFDIILEDINKLGRPDAHAKSINEDEFAQLRLHFKKLEGAIEKF